MGFVKYLGALAVAGSLVSCGGGSPGLPVVPPPSTGTGDTGTGTTPPPVASTTADLIVNVDKASLSNSGSDKVVLTATAVDASRNTVSGAPVTVALDSNAVFAKSS